tara:strand:- start:5286 stop:6035 length:750 start_codon:yes stop_codon:yes gene_type:complete
MADLFDPADQEIGPELVVGNDTPETAYIPDTNADPEGSANRVVEAEVRLPDWYYRKYALNDFGKPVYNQAVVNNIMAIFDDKINTAQQFTQHEEGEENSEQLYFEAQCNDIIAGQRVLLEVDPQSTGFAFLQLCTKTWSEFCSVCHEYADGMDSVKDDEIPEWLIGREEAMFQLGRKARLLKQALEAVGHDFGLQNYSIERHRVEKAVQDRCQRLAEYSFNKNADSSGVVRKRLNSATAEHMQSIIESV